MISSWLIWVIIGVACLIIEMLNAGFGIICFSIGAMLSAILAACGLGLVWQLAALALGTFVSFLFVRPIMIKWFDANKETKTNLDTMVGRSAVAVTNFEKGQGRVAIDGTDWMAESAADAEIKKGDKVQVTGRESNKVFVK